MVHISMMRLKFCYIPTNKVILGVGCMMLAHIYTHDACTHDACTHDAYTHDACMHESMMHECIMHISCMHDAYLQNTQITLTKC